MISTKFLYRLTAIAIFLFQGITLTQASGQQSTTKSANNSANDATLTYMTVSPDVAAKTLSTAQEIGKLNADTYYFISAGMPGIGQIIRVKTTDHTQYMPVGVVNKGTAIISNATEKAAFEQVQNNMTVGQARAIGLSGGSDATQQLAPQDVTPANAQLRPSTGTALKRDDGTIEVTFDQNGGTVYFRKVGNILIKTPNGETKAELKYNGITADQTVGDKAKRGVGAAGRMIGAAETNGLAGNINQNAYTIDYYRDGVKVSTINTDRYNFGRSGNLEVAAQVLDAFKIAEQANLLQEKDLRGRSVLVELSGRKTSSSAHGSGN